MKQLVVLCLLFTSLLLPQAYAAISLPAAKQQGLIGEVYTGYIALTPHGKQQPDKQRRALEQLVSSINTQRHRAFSRIASQQGAELSVVEALAAEKSLSKTPRGQYIRLPGQDWRKK